MIYKCSDDLFSQNLLTVVTNCISIRLIPVKQ